MSLINGRNLNNTASVFADLQPYQHHESVYGVITVKKGFFNPVRKWNYEEAIVIETNVKIILYDTTIVDDDIEGPTDNGTMNQKDHPGLKKTGHI